MACDGLQPQNGGFRGRQILLIFGSRACHQRGGWGRSCFVDCRRRLSDDHVIGPTHPFQRASEVPSFNVKSLLIGQSLELAAHNP